MKTSYSDVKYMKKLAVFQAQAMAANPPAIFFNRGKKEPTEKKKDDELTKKRFKIRLEPDNEDSDELQVFATIFETGKPEEWIRWRIQMDELIRDMPLDSRRKKIKVAQSLLKGEARDRFTTILTDLEMADENEPDVDDADDLRFEEALERLGRKYFPSKNAYRRQRNYLRFHVFMMDMPLEDFRLA
jgi:hypothetical protein